MYQNNELVTMAQYPYCCMKKKLKTELETTQRLKAKQTKSHYFNPHSDPSPFDSLRLLEVIINKLSNMISKLQEIKLHKRKLIKLLQPLF